MLTGVLLNVLRQKKKGKAEAEQQKQQQSNNKWNYRQSSKSNNKALKEAKAGKKTAAKQHKIRSSPRESVFMKDRSKHSRTVKMKGVLQSWEVKREKGFNATLEGCHQVHALQALCPVAAILLRDLANGALRNLESLPIGSRLHWPLANLETQIPLPCCGPTNRQLLVALSGSSDGALWVQLCERLGNLLRSSPPVCCPMLGDFTVKLSEGPSTPDSIRHQLHKLAILVLVSCTLTSANIAQKDGNASVVKQEGMIQSLSQAQVG